MRIAINIRQREIRYLVTHLDLHRGKFVTSTGSPQKEQPQAKYERKPDSVHPHPRCNPELYTYYNKTGGLLDCRFAVVLCLTSRLLIPAKAGIQL
jgi:hypothetical protein